MRLTIEPTVRLEGDINCVGPKVSIEKPSDDLTLDEVTELFKGLLVAYGYSPRDVGEIQ